LGALVRRPVIDTFKDSADLRLLRAGLALRERSEDGKFRISVKGLGNTAIGYHVREELEEVRRERLSTVDELAGPLFERIGPIVAGEAFVDLFSFSQERHVRSVCRGGSSVAQLSVDKIVLSGDGKTETYYEVEVEAETERGATEIGQIGRWLSDAFGLRFELRTKFEKAAEFFGLDLPQRADARTHVHSDMPLAAAVGHVVAHQFGLMLANESEVLSSQAHSAVHQMRVAAQRARSMLRLMPHRSRESERANAFLRSVRNQLGLLRDLQVLPRTLDRILQIDLRASEGAVSLSHGGAEKPADKEATVLRDSREAAPVDGRDPTQVESGEVAQVDGPNPAHANGGAASRAKLEASPSLLREVDLAKEALAERRNDVSDQLLTFLRSDDYRAGREEFLQGGITFIQPSYRTVPRELRHALTGALWHRISRADSYRKNMDRHSKRDHHELRKLIKDVRYLLELFAPLFGASGARLARAAVGVQGHLGIVQDTVVAEELLAATSLSQPMIFAAFELLARAAMDDATVAWIEYCDPQLRADSLRELI
jgi:CHAD domain-containing protein